VTTSAHLIVLMPFSPVFLWKFLKEHGVFEQELSMVRVCAKLSNLLEAMEV
jgi:hypothetical protein